MMGRSFGELVLSVTNPQMENNLIVTYLEKMKLKNTGAWLYFKEFVDAAEEYVKKACKSVLYLQLLQLFACGRLLCLFANLPALVAV